MPYLYYIIPGILLIAVIITIVVVICTHTGKNKRIELSYSSRKRCILASGKRREYVISIDGEYEFMVRDGQLVTSRCKSHKDQLISYTGGEKA